MLICPNCNHNLTPLTVSISVYSKMEIDHCYYCGGFWFDHYEINRVPVSRILNFKSGLTNEEISDLSGSNKCPRDQTILKRLIAESIPGDVIIMQCPKCQGNFANKFDLYQFKVAQKKKIDYFKTWKIPLPNLNSVLIPVFFLFLATGGIFLVAKNVQQSQNNRIKANQIIKQPVVSVTENNLVLVSFSTTIPVRSSIIYQAKSDKEPQTHPINQNPATQHLITIRNLSAKTDYFFKISIEDESGKVITSTSYSFVTN